MKKSTQFIFTIFVTLITLFSCTNVSDKKDTKADTAKIAIDTAGINQASVAEKILLPTDIKVKMFYEVQSYVDEDGVLHKTEYYEKPDFMKKESELFCFGQDFMKIEIFANGKNISFIVNLENKTIFKKNDLEIKDKITFTNKDFNFIFGNYMILVKQGDNILFKKEVEVTTCD
jgi:hypothetical protein